MTSLSNLPFTQQLINISDEYIGVGAVFIFPVYDFRAGEKYAELMLVQSSAEGALFEFVPISGYESGKKFGSFVLENYTEDANNAVVKTEWLKKNWNRVAYLDSKVSEVYVLRRDCPKKYPPVDDSDDVLD
jgi:hypothetical protein